MRKRMSEDIEKRCDTCKHQHDEILICTKNPGRCFPEAKGEYLLWESRFPEDNVAYAEAAADQPALATQVGGGHYKGYAIQPVEFCMKNKLDYCQSNIIKYVVRFRDKNGLEDLKKAKHYLEMLMEMEYGNQ
jgi:hypothetical protein